MRAAIYRSFDGPITIEDVPDPVPSGDGVVIKVEASGVCRSDFHGWRGLDADIALPMVPGHELAGVVHAAGPEVHDWGVGDRVTVPFCCGCGVCEQCAAGNTQVCDDYFQPGFTGWGSFAELVAIPSADLNLVRLPDDLDFAEAAILGCRFMTAYRAVAQRARVGAGEWLAVFGCGGVGQSVVLIGGARGARVVAVDVNEEALHLARALGAVATINSSDADVPAAITHETSGGAHVTIDAIGNPQVAADAVLSLRKLGRHVQVGLLNEGPTPLPMDAVIARELEILGSHGMPVSSYDEIFDLIAGMDLSQLITARISLDELPEALAAMGGATSPGIAVVTEF